MGVRTLSPCVAKVNPGFAAIVNIYAGIDAMKAFRIYSAIVTALKSGRLQEPFTTNDSGRLVPVSAKQPMGHSWTSIAKEIPMATRSCLNENRQAVLNACDRFAIACEDDLFQSDGGTVLPGMRMSAASLRQGIPVILQET